MKQSAPLSKTQYGIYAECVQHLGEYCYNLTFLYTLDGSLDEARLKVAIESVVAAHPTLFTRIELNEQGEPVQTIDDSETFCLEVEHVADIEAEKQGMVKAFDIYNDRLFRFRLLNDGKHFYLFIDLHHIISDGTTLKLILQDIDAAYGGKTLEAEVMTQADVVREEAEMRQTPAFEAAKQWYAENFDCSDTFSQLMPDLEETESEIGASVRRMSVSLEAIDAYCKSHGIFRNTFFNSVYGYLMAKYNNDQEALFSTVYSGRTDKRLARTVAMVVKTVPVYVKFNNDTTVLDFLKSGEEQMRGVREHNAYSYIDVMSDLHLQIGSFFAWHGTLLDRVNIGGCLTESLELNKTSLEVPLYVKATIIDDHCYVDAEYRTNVYSEQMISQLLESYEAVVEGFLKEEYLRDISIATKAQVELLDSFNQTDVPYDDTQTIVSLFRRQAKATPDNIAIAFKDKKYTYQEVDEISDRIAGYIVDRLQLLAKSGDGAGQTVDNSEPVVSILIPRCEWMAIASLGVLKAGCAYQPLDPSYPKERLNFMMQDAHAQLLIADEELRPLADEYQGEVLLTKDIPTLTSLPSHILTSQLNPDRLFILLYTSGSTGVPKGCQLTHANLVCFCHWYQRYYELTPDSRVAAYASYGFDANMMDMYPALTCGATVYIVPEELRLDLIALNEYFEQNQITHSFMTTQVGYQFATSIENHSLKHISVGGEKLASLTPPSNVTLTNLYGPTEGTVCITRFKISKTMKDIPIGAALDNVKLYVVDSAGHRLPVGAAGELWVSGPHVGRGYLNRPKKTAEVFINNPFATPTSQYARVYRTGDIVRYLPDGNIQFVGRKDSQVKIRGFRIELKEVETVIREFPGIKDATVQAFEEEGGGKFIAAYIVSNEPIDIEALNSFILEQKPPYMVPAVTMQIDRIPLNQNQKVNKKALPKPEKKASGAEGERNVPMNVLEQEIHSLISQIINTKDFGVTTVLGYVGLTSIMAIKLAIQINKRFGVTLDSKALAKTGSVQSIENEILKAFMSGDATKQETAEVAHADMSSIPLSYAQMGVYVDCMRQPTSTVYNIPAAIRFPKGTDVQLFSKSVETIIKAHPQFHVHFDSEGGDIIQMMDVNQPVVIAQSQLSEAEIEKYMADFVKPFNLRQGPLYRMEIVTTEESVYLLADVHHLIFDGASFDLFIDQLCDLMNGKKIEPETFTYADFVAAQKEAESSQEYAEARHFFQERLDKIEGATEITADLVNPKEQGLVGTIYTPLNFDKIDSFCRQNNISPAHHLLAATFYALARFTNNEQLCITTISNGRSDLRISNTVGMFVNTLALSAFIEEQSVMDFINETSKNFDETLRHETYPFARIAADYDLSAEIIFAYQMGVLEGHEYKGQPVTMKMFESDTPKFRIAFFIMPDPSGKPCICLQYDNGRYSQELMQSLAQSINNAANAFISNPDAKLKSISLLDEKQTTLLDSFNQTNVPYDDTQTIVSLFRKQVERVPDNIAVVYKDVRLTYQQVDEISDRIAGYIVDRLQLLAKSGDGAGQTVDNGEPVVSILIPRCEWMALASLGVLKAGCAYQPLDPSYPKERLNFMMQDAHAQMLIADEELRPLVDEYQGEVLFTKDIGNLKDSKVFDGPKPESLFTLIYTSGSTGVPKGCQLEHRNIVAFCHMNIHEMHIEADSHIGAYASFGFDACLQELWSPLIVGATTYIIPEEIRLDLIALNDYFEKNSITHTFMTTQVARSFVNDISNHSLKAFITGGEKLADVNPPSYLLLNGYGPSESICYITAFPVTEKLQNIPIGKAVENMHLYIMDAHGHRLPMGAAGELWVNGPQVGRGYLNRPEKTAESFIETPWGRCYRTGDIVRYLPDGNIQFVGRKDSQVKIRGFRIELKEVEAVIREFPGIKDATIQAFDYENGGKFIAAYIVSNEQIDIKELNDFIGKQKPSYMIPAATMQIDSIPLNQNQKVNKKALPAPVIQAADHNYVEPANDTEKLFCGIFSEVLSMEKIGATDNFFELGGTSLMVTKMIIEADKAGHHVAYGDVFTHATPRLLAQFVTGETPVENTDDEVTNFDYTGINAILQQNNVESFLKGERQQLGHVLLTGATGYLGIHVLRELIDSDAATITCLVRGQDQQTAERRLKNLLFYYFEKSYKELFGTRLFVVNGDVTQDLSTLTSKIDTVFNCAANVKHFSKTSDIEDVNIGGAQRCVEFCLKTGAKLVHISTTSIGEILIIRNNGEEVPKFDERKFWFGQFLDNRYIHSKFLAERFVLDAVAHHGLKGKVMRVGNLAPRSYDGEFQVNFESNSFMGRLKTFYTLNCCPYDSYDELTELSPIDQTAKAVVLLASTPKECTVFQPFNNHTELLGDVLKLMNKVGKDIRFVEAEDFEKALVEAGRDPEKAKILSALMAYQDMTHGQKAVFIERDNRYTCAVLHRLGFLWSDTAWDYVERLLKAIDGLGFFDRRRS